jgi:uncharacterized protein (TIGR02118 family)
MYKFTVFMKRLPSMTQEAFVDYHRNKHAPLFLALPATKKYVRRYVQSHPISTSVLGFRETSFDGLTEIWFDDMGSFEALFNDAEYLHRIRPDEASFVDLERSEILLMNENVVIR